jgi:hypothetical protein
MKLSSIFGRPAEQRTDKFTLRPHETLVGRYRIIRFSDNKPMGIIEGLRRASDFTENINLVKAHDLDLSELSMPEWKIKIQRIEQMIKERKEKWIYVGAVDDERAA